MAVSAASGLAGHVVSGFLDGCAQCRVTRKRIAANNDGASGNVDFDSGDASELADFCPDGPGAVVAGHSGHLERAGFHNRE